MINPERIKPVVKQWKQWIRAGAILALAIAAVGAGWVIEHWHKSAEIEKLQGEISILKTVNTQCTVDVKNARAAMQTLINESDERVRQAEEAMKQAEPQVKERIVTLTKIKTLPQVAPSMQCEAIKQEQIEYLMMRRGA